MSDPRWSSWTATIAHTAAQETTFEDVERVLAALADAGILLPPGGETRTEDSWSHSDETDCINPSCPDRHLVRRTVTEWPDGTELLTPWQPVGGEDR